MTVLVDALVSGLVLPSGITVTKHDSAVYPEVDYSFFDVGDVGTNLVAELFCSEKAVLFDCYGVHYVMEWLFFEREVFNDEVFRLLVAHRRLNYFEFKYGFN